MMITFLEGKVGEHPILEVSLICRAHTLDYIHKLYTFLLLLLCSLKGREINDTGDEYIDISKASGKFGGEWSINVEDPKIPPLVSIGFKIP